MKKSIKILIGFLVVGLILAGASVSSYNSLIDLEGDVQIKESHIQNQLQYRFDKMSQLIRAVESGLDHESQLFKDIAALRSNVDGINIDDDGTMTIKPEATVEELSTIDKQMSQININYQNEAYPEIKGNDLIIRLMDEAVSNEVQLKNARLEYNETAGLYNKTIRKFPKSIFANMLGFKQVPLFEASDQAQNEIPTMGGK